MSEIDFDAALSEVADAPFRPIARYDRDGDCMEFFYKREPFYAVRKDALLTVYYSRETNEIIGSLIKRVESILKRYPGFRIDVVGGKMRFEHVVRALAWQASDPELTRVYNELSKIADESETEVELCGP